MNKWFNKQKPLSLAVITLITSFLTCFLILIYFSVDISNLVLIKVSLSISILMFFLSWLMFYQSEVSDKVFKEIDSIYFRAKKAKTRDELNKLKVDYDLLRKKCQHHNHYYKMNSVWEILTTKEEFL